MLSKSNIKNIDKNWNPERWPEGPAWNYAKAMHRLPFTYFRERVNHLGLTGSLLVDAGCGTGTWSFALATVFDRVVSIDSTHDRSEVAKALKEKFKVKQPEFVEGDIRKIPVKDGAADAVFCYSVLLGALPMEAIYAEFYRVLRPGGIAYIELNGIGYGWNLFRMEGQNKKIGGDIIYNTYGRTALAEIVPLIAPDCVAHAAALKVLEEGEPLNVFKAAKVSPHVLNVANIIVNELAGDYPALLLSDLGAIARGERNQFSQPSMGRGYTPEDLQAYSAAAGFKRFEWAPEGMLSLQRDGTVKKEESETAKPISAPEFEGHLRRFESFSWK